MKLRSLALTAVTAGALGLSGCGDDDTSTGNAGGGNTSDPNTLLVNTFQPGSGAKIKSGTIELKASGTLSGTDSGKGEATALIKLDKAEEGAIPEFSADVKVDAEQKGGKKIDFQAGGVFTDNRFYINYDGDSYDVGDDLSKRAITSLQAAIKQGATTPDESTDMVARLGLDPQTWLKNPKVDGE